MCSDTAWSIPCRAVGSASMSGKEGPLSAVVALFWELNNEGRSEESGAAGTKEEEASVQLLG